MSGLEMFHREFDNGWSVNLSNPDSGQAWSFTDCDRESNHIFLNLLQDPGDSDVLSYGWLFTCRFRATERDDVYQLIGKRLMGVFTSINTGHSYNVLSNVTQGQFNFPDGPEESFIRVELMGPVGLPSLGEIEIDPILNAAPTIRHRLERR